VNQHLVSRVLLRQWANREKGPICGLDLESLSQRIGSVDSFGAIEDLITKESERLEKLWNNEVERKLAHPFELLRQGSILESKNKKYLRCLLDCLALHWARSHTLALLVQQLKPKAVDQVVSGVLGKYTATEAVRAMTGVYIPGPTAYFVFRQRVDEELTARLHDSLIPEEFEKNFKIARDKLEGVGLEICVATQSEFIVGDCPVATWNKSLNKVGPLNGVGWHDADAIFMPLGPRYLIAVSKESRYRDLNEAEVVTLNRLQVQGAYREIYSRPGSGIAELVAEALLASQSQAASG
jgi:hypothetical protein